MVKQLVRAIKTILKKNIHKVDSFSKDSPVSKKLKIKALEDAIERGTDNPGQSRNGISLIFQDKEQPQLN